MGVTPSFTDGLTVKAANNSTAGANPTGLNNAFADALSLSQATSQTVTGPLILNSSISSVITPTITWSGSTPTSNSAALFTSLVHNGSTTSTTGIGIYDWNIGADRIALSNPSPAASVGYQFTHIYGGGAGGVGGATNCVGSRIALSVNLNNQSATNTDAVLGVSPFLVAGAFNTQIAYNEGGTSNVYPGKSRGAAFGTNPVSILNSGATNYLGCVGEEVNVQISSGASAQEKVGIQIVKLSGDAVKGGNGYDVAIKITDAHPAQAWDNGIMFGHPAAQWPFGSTSVLIGAYESQDDVATAPCIAATGIDFTRVIFSNAAFASMGFKIDGSGNATFGNDIQLGNFKFQTAAAGLVIDANDHTALTFAVSAGGSAWAVGDKFTTATGGVYEVATISGSAAVTVTQIVPDISASPPSNPVSTTATNSNVFRGGGTGLTLNLTWTASNTLSLNPSGGAILASALASSTTYASDSAAATGGVAVGQFYRNGSVVQIRVS